MIFYLNDFYIVIFGFLQSYGMLLRKLKGCDDQSVVLRSI